MGCKRFGIFGSEWQGECFKHGEESDRVPMLRISVLDSSNGLKVYRLEGMVIGRWVIELQELCEDALGRRQEVVVDLSDVSYVDREGIALLLRLRNRKVALTNPQPFVAELLKG